MILWNKRTGCSKVLQMFSRTNGNLKYKKKIFDVRNGAASHYYGDIIHEYSANFQKTFAKIHRVLDTSQFH